MDVRLAGTTAGEGHRRQVWQVRRRVVATNRTLFAIAAVMALVIIVGLAIVDAVVVHSAFLAGLTIGGLATGIAAALLWLIDSVAGSHNHRFGSYGEERTAGLFESRRMQRAGWPVVHNLSVRKDRRC